MPDVDEGAQAHGEKVTEILTVPEVAVRLRVASSWVYTNAAALGGSKVGRYVRFTQGSIDAYLAAHRCE